jgi:transcriptional regulator with XRE-family HTH domain
MGIAMASKKLDEEFTEIVRQRIEEVVLRDFADVERQAAIGLNIPQPSINNLRHGRGSLGILTLIRLADYLGISIDELIGRQEPPPRDETIHPRYEADRYPERARAATIACKLWYLPSAISRACQDKLRRGEIVPASVWLERIQAYHRVMSEEISAEIELPNLHLPNRLPR